MIDPPAVLAIFEAEMRRNPVPDPGSQVEHVGPIVRVVGAENAVLFSNLGGEDARAVVAAQADFFRRREVEAEWKVYGYDEPADLEAILAAAGFRPDEPETLLAFDLRDSIPEGGPPTGIEVRRVTSAEGVHDAVSTNQASFGADDPELAARYERLLLEPSQALFVAYAGDEPVASGRLEMTPGRSFASLWGGGTVPAYRGRGVYRQLVSVRAALARSRGYRFLTVDARETSRPILGRLGFVALTSTRGWKLRPRIDGGPAPPGATTPRPPSASGPRPAVRPSRP